MGYALGEAGVSVEGGGPFDGNDRLADLIQSIDDSSTEADNLINTLSQSDDGK